MKIYYYSVFGLLLAGCFTSPEEDLQTWMVNERAQMKPHVQPLSEPKKFTPYPYANAKVVEPFNAIKLKGSPSTAGTTQASVDSPLWAAEQRRRKEPLEAYPLDSMSFVGSLQKKDKKVALLKVEKMLYQVMLGSYIGQNYGKITKITETELVLREIMQDASGEWIERPTVLQLQEEKK